MPRFITTRCIANALCRRSGGVISVMRVDCAGQNDPLPMPVMVAIRKPFQALSTSTYPAYPTVRNTNEAASTRRPPIRSTSTPAMGPATMLTTAFVASTSPAVPSEIPRTLWR